MFVTIKEINIVKPVEFANFLQKMCHWVPKYYEASSTWIPPEKSGYEEGVFDKKKSWIFSSSEKKTYSDWHHIFLTKRELWASVFAGFDDLWLKNWFQFFFILVNMMSHCVCRKTALLKCISFTNCKKITTHSFWARNLILVLK